jgi:hypothetical protein
VNDFWGTAEMMVRDALFQVTGLIPNEAAAGLLFGVGLIFSDHVFRVAEKVLP